MSSWTSARPDTDRPGASGGNAPMRVAVIDTDSGFLQVLGKRLDRLGWEHRTLAGPVRVDEIVAMRLSALIVDLTVFGPRAWEELERLCEALPGLAAAPGLDPEPPAPAPAPRGRLGAGLRSGGGGRAGPPRGAARSRGCRGGSPRPPSRAGRAAGWRRRREGRPGRGSMS